VGIAAGFSVALARDIVPTNWQPIGGGVLSREKQRVSDLLLIDRCHSVKQSGKCQLWE